MGYADFEATSDPKRITPSQQSTERATAFTNLEPRSDIFDGSVAANVVGSPPVSPRGSTYPTISEWSTGRSTTSVAALEGY